MPSKPFLPLKGVRVLSFEVAYSLPAGTRTLAELGAEVVRVAGPGRDSFYISVVDGVYLSKPCIGINLKDPRGLEIAKQLATKADALCSNFVPGVMERLGLGPDVLRALNPALIVLQLSGYGSPGPWSAYPAFGPSTEAAGGMNALIGREGQAPVRIGSGVFSDQLGGRFAALALIAALEQRQSSRGRSEGRYIDLSMAEAISTLIGHTVLAAARGEGDPPRRVNRDRDYAPQGVYPCHGDDEWIAITVKDDSQWQTLVRLLPLARDDVGAASVSDRSGLGAVEGPGGEGRMLARPELASTRARHANHDEIDEALARWTATFDKHALEKLLQAKGIAASAVQRSRDPLFDEHLKARGVFQVVEHERPILGYAAHPHPTTPWFASGHDRAELRDLHFHGADNAAILGNWLGMPSGEVTALEDSGALIVLRDVEVEDRRTAYRDANHAQQLGLTPAAPEAPLSRDAARNLGLVGRGDNAHVGGEGRTASPQGRPIRILEISGGPAAAFAAMLLAELGHEVIRVELPDWHAQRRPATATLNATEQAFLGRRKKSLVLDQETWPSRVLELASNFDAVVEDLGPGALGSLGITTHRLRQANRGIIVASISPYGLTGPKKNWPASELTVQASAGPLHSTGFSDDAPAKAGGFAAHHIAGLNAATAVLARRYGILAGRVRGGLIDVSMQETYLHHWTRHIGEWTYTGTKMRREKPGFGHQGFRHTAMANDGWLYVLSLYASWEEIAAFFGLDEFITPEWSNAEYRMDHWPELEGPYHKAVASRGRYEWFAAGSDANYTFAPVHSATDQLSNAQFAERGFLKPAEIDGQQAVSPGLPFNWQEPAMPNRPPRLGEHNAEVLGASRGDSP